MFEVYSAPGGDISMAWLTFFGSVPLMCYILVESQKRPGVHSNEIYAPEGGTKHKFDF